MYMKFARAAALSMIACGVGMTPPPAMAQGVGTLMVAITAPGPGSTVSGSITVRASVTTIGSLTVTGVQFTLAGARRRRKCDHLQRGHCHRLELFQRHDATDGQHHIPRVRLDGLGHDHRDRRRRRQRWRSRRSVPARWGQLRRGGYQRSLLGLV